MGRMRKFLSILVLVLAVQAKRGSIYDQLDTRPTTFLDEFDDLDNDFGLLDQDLIDERDALDVSPDDILQALIDYQSLVDEIDDEMKKGQHSKPTTYDEISNLSVQPLSRVDQLVADLSQTSQKPMLMIPKRNGSKMNGSRKKDSPRRGRKNKFLGSFKRSFI